MDHLLIVDDDPATRALLARYLSENDYRVSAAANGREMRRVLASTPPDLVVLDIMMPGEDGITLFRDLSARSSIPVVFLTAKNEPVDRILGMELGADDYIPKPFEPRELLARVRAILRRVRALPANIAPEDVREYHFAGWTLTVPTRELLTPSKVVMHLSGTEFRLLKLFLDHPRTVLSRAQIAEYVHGKDVQPLDRCVDVVLCRLRQHLGESARNAKLIRTIRYEGYRFDAEVDVED